MPTLTKQFRAAGSSWRLTYNFGAVVVERWHAGGWEVVPLFLQPAYVSRRAAELAGEVQRGVVGGEGVTA